MQGTDTHRHTKTHFNSPISLSHMVGQCKNPGNQIQIVGAPTLVNVIVDDNENPQLKVTQTFKCQGLEEDERQWLNRLWSPGSQSSRVTMICEVQLSISLFEPI